MTYTCDVRPSEAAQQALRAWVEAGGRWFALHGTNTAIDPPAARGEGPFTTPRAFPVFADTLGSQFLSHPTIEPYPVTITPGAEEDPLVEGIEDFDAHDELYLCEYHGELEPLLQTRWTGTTHGVRRGLVAGRRPSAGHVPPAPGRGCVLYLTLGPLPRPLRHGRTALRRQLLARQASAARGRSPSSTSCCGGACRGPRRRPGPPSRPGAPGGAPV